MQSIVKNKGTASAFRCMSSSSISYCSELVRKHEYEMYLCTLLIPEKSLRTKLMAIRSFNTEIALIRDQVTQKDIGLTRLAFWRDAIDQLFEWKMKKRVGVREILRQPTIIELSRVIGESNLSKKWFLNLLDGRERLMGDGAFNNFPELEGYCDKTVSSIFYLAFEILGVKNVELDHCASHLGKAIGISTVLRSVPYNAGRRRVFIPNELLLKHGVSQENFIRAENPDKIKELAFEMASQANSHYEKAKKFKSVVDDKALPVLLSGVPSAVYLKRLQQVDFNIFHPSFHQRYGLLPWHLYYMKITKSYF